MINKTLLQNGLMGQPYLTIDMQMYKKDGTFITFNLKGTI